MLRKKLIVISLFCASIIASCTTVDNELGNELIPESDKMVFSTTTFENFNTYTTSVDSVTSSNWGYTILGSIVTPWWGQTNYSCISTYLPYSGFNKDSIWGDEPTIDSARFVITPYGYSGDSTLTQTITVYKLNKMLPNFRDTSFYSNFPYKEFTDPTPFTTLHIRNTKSFKSDIPMEFAKSLLDTTGGIFKNDSLFIGKYFGFMMKSNSYFSGGVTRDINLEKTGIEIYYHNKNKPIADTTVAFFAMTNSSATYNVGFTMIDHDYNLADPVIGLNKALINDTLKSQDITYILSQGGLTTRIGLKKEYFDDLKKKAKDLGFENIAISNATLILPLQNTTPVLMDTSIISLGAYINYQKTMLTSDYFALVQSQNNQQQGQTPPPFGGQLNRALQQYSMNITSHVQSILSGKQENYNIEIAPAIKSVVSNRGVTINSKGIKLELSYVMVHK
ncbi:MAG: DUF4270 family protein [Rikenellaceae bacterium]